MNAENVRDLLVSHRLLAVLRLNDLSQADSLVAALLEAGVRLMEITLTNADAVPVTRRLRQTVTAFEDGTAALGVGSVISVGQARASVAAGAQFVVTPAVDNEVIRYCIGAQIPVFPGALTPTEILAAQKAGATTLKLFPAGRMEPAYIKDLLGPFPDLELVPTGGVNLGNLGEFLQCGALAVGVGGNLLDSTAVASGDWQAVSRHAARYVEAAAP